MCVSFGKDGLLQDNKQFENYYLDAPLHTVSFLTLGGGGEVNI